MLVTPSTVEYLTSFICEQVGRISLEDVPWLHGVTAPMLPWDFAQSLTSEIFTQEFVSDSRRTGDKTYSFATLRLHKADLGMSGILLESLDSESYRDTLNHILDVDLDNAYMCVDAWEYGVSDWLSPHVDKPEKIVTQIIYLSDHESSDCGGRLLLLRDANSNFTVSAIEPNYLSSVVFAPSPKSWHAVEPIHREDYRRRSLTVTYYSQKPERI